MARVRRTSWYDGLPNNVGRTSSASGPISSIAAYSSLTSRTHTSVRSIAEAEGVTNGDWLGLASDQALADPKLLADAKKMDAPIAPATGEHVQQVISEALLQSPQNLQLLVQAVKAAP